MIIPLAPLLTPLPAVFKQNLIVLDLEVEGRPARFLLDSGSAFSGVLSKGNKKPTARLRFASGTGELTCELKAVKESDMPRVLPNLDGFLGTDFLQHHQLLVDYEAKKVALVQGRPLSLSALSALVPSKWESVPLDLQDGLYHARNERKRILFDTGANALTLTPDDIPRGALSLPPIAATFWGGTRAAPAVLVPSLRFLNVNYNNCIALVEDEKTGLVPARWMTRRRLFLDFGHKLVCREAPDALESETRTGSYVACFPVSIAGDGIFVKPPEVVAEMPVLRVGGVPSKQFLQWLRNPLSADKLLKLADAQRESLILSVKAPDGAEKRISAAAYPSREPGSTYIYRPKTAGPGGVTPLLFGITHVPPGYAIIGLPPEAKVEADPDVPGGHIVNLLPPAEKN